MCFISPSTFYSLLSTTNCTSAQDRSSLECVDDRMFVALMSALNGRGQEKFFQDLEDVPDRVSVAILWIT